MVAEQKRVTRRTKEEFGCEEEWNFWRWEKGLNKMKWE